MCDKRRISASIVLYNSDIEQLKIVINSYAPSEKRILYLIDNSPEKNDIESILPNKSNIHYYFIGKNNGFGAGHNIAIKKAMQIGTQYHLVLNPDLQFAPEIIENIADFMDKDISIAQIMPKVLNKNGELQYLCKLLPAPLNLIFRRFVPNLKYFHKLNEKYILHNFNYNTIINPPSLSGCFMFLRMDIIKKNDLLFDERFFLYCEDIDFVRRLHQIAKTIYYPYVFVVHAHAKDSYKSKKMMFEHIKSAIRYFNKWGWFNDNERKKMNEKILEEIKVGENYEQKHRK